MVGVETNRDRDARCQAPQEELIWGGSCIGSADEGRLVGSPAQVPCVEVDLGSCSRRAVTSAMRDDGIVHRSETARVSRSIDQSLCCSRNTSAANAPPVNGPTR